jgi:soluble lytic murein transglycosylase-like protein
VLRVGFGLVLILNATEAGTMGTAGAIRASLGTVHAMPVAVTEAALRGAEPGVSDPAKASDVPAAELSDSDAAHYAQAFDEAADGNGPAMQYELAQVHDKRLTGNVLAARYLSPNAKASYAELSDWLRHYADLAEAEDIYRLAMRRKPASAPGPDHPRPASGYVGSSLPPCRLPGIAVMGRMKLAGDYDPEDLKRVNHLVNTVLAHLRDDAPTTALHILQASETTDLLDHDDLASLQARVAAELLYDGDNGPALNMASESLADGDDEALWTAGLAAYRLKRFDEAMDHFKSLAEDEGAEPWTASAASFWAGRAAARMDDPMAATEWWKRAAGYKATFYGMLAERTLGQKPALQLSSPTVSPADRQLLTSIPAGSRALALIQLGETARAEAELNQIEASHNPQLKQTLLAVAASAHLPDLSQRLGIGLTGIGGRQYDSGPYPIPRWQPHGGYSVDPSLIHAIMRQESRFDPSAESDAGALGLMQIMPQTASEMSQRKLNWEDALFDPETNLDIGQRYVSTLLSSAKVSGNLIMLAAAYNGGPGNLTRWRDNGDEDPLTFLETLPAGETRGFVEQVLTNYWIYRLQAGEDTKSLNDLAHGKWPMYEAPSNQTMLADAR